MPISDIELLKLVIPKSWSSNPDDKVKKYVDKFFATTRVAAKLKAKVEGNHGTYTVSLQAKEGRIISACSCYMGKKHGECHHCQALAVTFLKNPAQFNEMKQQSLEEVKKIDDLPAYLQQITLDELMQGLRKNGITQQAFAENIGMSSQKLSAIKASERRNRYFHELGAVKLACLWALEKFQKT